MCLCSMAQKIVFSPDKGKEEYASEDLDIEFQKKATGQEIKFPAKPGKEFAPALVALLPSLLDVGMKLTTNALDKRAKSYSGEYSKQKSYLNAGDGDVPDFKLIRTITIASQTKEAIVVGFKATKVANMEAFIYSLNSLNLNYSTSRFKEKDLALDYTFEIKISYFVNGEKKVQELAPLTINSVTFGNHDYSTNNNKYRTDIIPLPEGGLLSEIAIKVIETNPAKVKAEKILAQWNEQKDNVKTVINNFLPKEEKEEDEGEEGEEAGSEKDKGKKRDGGK